MSNEEETDELEDYNSEQELTSICSENLTGPEKQHLIGWEATYSVPGQKVIIGIIWELRENEVVLKRGNRTYKVPYQGTGINYIQLKKRFILDQDQRIKMKEKKGIDVSQEKRIYPKDVEEGVLGWYPPSNISKKHKQSKKSETTSKKSKSTTSKKQSSSDVETSKKKETTKETKAETKKASSKADKKTEIKTSNSNKKSSNNKSETSKSKESKSTAKKASQKDTQSHTQTSKGGGKGTAGPAKKGTQTSTETKKSQKTKKKIPNTVFFIKE